VIDFEKALSIVRGAGSTLAAAPAPTAKPSIETVPLAEALGRVLARPLTSPIDSPPFDKSAMDGFAIGAEDDSPEYRILSVVAAGCLPDRAVKRGECARIMTGAMLPPGTARVIRKELAEEKAGTMRPLGPEPSDNVIRRGASIHTGDLVLGPRQLRPQDIGILAASGIAAVPVAVAPLVGILTTGSEIRPPGEPLDPGQIYDSNGPQLAAELAAMRCPSRSFGRVADRPDALREAVASALDSCRLLLLTGGVSEGDFDYVPRSLQSLGAEILIHGVAIKPGKPTLFARMGDRFIFGLPGNPVSTFVIFEVFVKELLYRLMGVDWSPPTLAAELGERVARRSAERTEFLPVRFLAGKAFPVAYHGSADLNALAETHGLVRIEKGVAAIEKGETVDVRPV
jgi:molybdopterin molybdotransferase